MFHKQPLCFAHHAVRSTMDNLVSHMGSANSDRVILQVLYVHENKDPGDAILIQAKQCAAAERISLTGLDILIGHQLFTGAALHLR